MKNTFTYKVDVIMLTYQHEKFINDAINGVISQRTDFNFRLLIFDDASTDNTNEIVLRKENPNSKLFINYHRNLNNLGALINGKNALKSSDSFFIAFCEGDDYWTDPYKLQKQVELLEQNPTANFCGAISQVQEYGLLKNIFISNYKNLETGIVSGYHFFKVNTLLIRRDFLFPILNFIGYFDSKNLNLNKIDFNEFTLNHLLNEFGKGVYYKNIVSVYRITNKGEWSGKTNLQKYIFQYSDVKSMRMHLKKRWSFIALQEIITWVIIVATSKGLKSKFFFFKKNFKDFLIVSFLFLIRLGFIRCVPDFINWLKIRKETGVGI